MIEPIESYNTRFNPVKKSLKSDKKYKKKKKVLKLFYYDHFLATSIPRTRPPTIPPTAPIYIYV
jgi:hypothetical protein